MSEPYAPTPEQVNAFKAAWHDADDDGQAGKRVEIALAKVLGPALAAARREGQAEALREASEDVLNVTWPHGHFPGVADAARFLVILADQVENGAAQ